MRKTLLTPLVLLALACSSSKASPDGGTCSSARSSDPCVTGTVCEYSSPLACEAGCSGGNYVRLECIEGKWQDTQHTLGSPSCYCRQTDARVDADDGDAAADRP